MSIDGFVEKVVRFPGKTPIQIELCGRQTESGYSDPGQHYLRIYLPTVEPQVGQTVWGSGSSVMIGDKEYVRWGYVGLIEKGCEKQAEELCEYPKLGDPMWRNADGA